MLSQLQFHAQWSQGRLDHWEAWRGIDGKSRNLKMGGTEDKGTNLIDA